jgi:hypothetical protein
MSPLIDEVLTKLKDKHGLSKVELERIIDSEFKVLELSIQKRSLKEVSLIYLGKVKPSKWFVHNYEKVVKETKRD